MDVGLTKTWAKPLNNRLRVADAYAARHIRRQSLACLLLFALLPAFASAGTLQGKVVHISDGDTLTVLVDHQQVKIRLAEIDAPESHQDYGQRAKQALGNLVFSKEVSVDYDRKDRYGRTIGRVYLGDLDVNAEMVRTGYAWVYRQYAKDKNLYALEDEARAARRGLWASDVHVPPWEWRKKRRERASKTVQ